MNTKNNQCLIWIAVCFVLILGCKETIDKYGSAKRPKEFPLDIYPSCNAFDITYASPIIDRIAEGTYGMFFYINEDYPAPNTISQIRDVMRSKGYVRIELYPEDFAVSTAVGNDPKHIYKLNQEETESLRESLKKTTESYVNKAEWKKTYLEGEIKGVVATYSWNEEWISTKDDLIKISLSYMQSEKQEELSKLFVQIYISTPSSAKHSYVLNYKKKHPEKFNSSKKIFEPNQIN